MEVGDFIRYDNQGCRHEVVVEFDRDSGSGGESYVGVLKHKSIEALGQGFTPDDAACSTIVDYEWQRDRLQRWMEEARVLERKRRRAATVLGDAMSDLGYKLRGSSPIDLLIDQSVTGDVEEASDLIKYFVHRGVQVFAKGFDKEDTT